MAKELMMDSKLAKQKIKEKMNEYEYGRDDRMHPYHISLTDLSLYVGYSENWLSAFLSQKTKETTVWKFQMIIDAIPRYAKKNGYVKVG